MTRCLRHSFLQRTRTLNLNDDEADANTRLGLSLLVGLERTSSAATYWSAFDPKQT